MAAKDLYLEVRDLLAHEVNEAAANHLLAQFQEVGEEAFYTAILKTFFREREDLRRIILRRHPELLLSDLAVAGSEPGGIQ
jgi:hypothetical protein